MRSSILASRSLAALVFLFASPALAEVGLALNAEGAAAHMVGDTKASQFGWGAAGIVAPELKLGRRVGFELPFGIVGVEQSQNQDPQFVRSLHAGSALFAMPGLRLRPFATERGGLSEGSVGRGRRRHRRDRDSRARPSTCARASTFRSAASWPDRPAVSIRLSNRTPGCAPKTRASRSAVGRSVRTDREGSPRQARGRGRRDVGPRRRRHPRRDDKCPDEPEDNDGFQDDDGCPDPDNDGDGIPDTIDKCPNEPEDKDGFQDDDGCPDPDNDGDGIPDEHDKCPNEPETFNGFEDDDGCPDEGQGARSTRARPHRARRPRSLPRQPVGESWV